MEEICKRLLMGIAVDGGKFFGEEAIDAFFKCVELGVDYSIKGVGRNNKLGNKRICGKVTKEKNVSL